MGEGLVRTNGFQCPLHPLQVLSWVVFGTDVLLFAVLCIPISRHVALTVIVSVVYFVSVTVVVLSAAFATYCNPADHNLRHGGDTESDHLPFCCVCNASVLPTSKHCRSCNKCVHRFDHHCMWLNNCVGHDNYRYFIAAISAVAVMTATILGLCTWLMAEYFAQPTRFSRQLESVFGDFPKPVALAMFILLLSVNSVFFVLDIQLLLFHAFLNSHGLTTHEYIMRKRDCKENTKMPLAQRCVTCCMDTLVVKRRKRRRSPVSEEADDGPHPEAPPVPPALLVEPQKLGVVSVTDEKGES